MPSGRSAADRRLWRPLGTPATVAAFGGFGGFGGSGGFGAPEPGVADRRERLLPGGHGRVDEVAPALGERHDLGRVAELDLVPSEIVLVVDVQVTLAGEDDVEVEVDHRHLPLGRGGVIVLAPSP